MMGLSGIENLPFAYVILVPLAGTEIPLYAFAMKPFPKIEDENELRAPTNSASTLAGANYLNYHLAGRARNKPCEFLGFQTVGFRLFYESLSTHSDKLPQTDSSIPGEVEVDQ